MNTENNNTLKIPELSDTEVERLAGEVPALSKSAAKRITASCMSKMGSTAAVGSEAAEGEVVTGTEIYSGRRYIRYISAIAACAAAFVCVMGVFLVNKNLRRGPEDMEPTAPVVVESTAPNENIAATTTSGSGTSLAESTSSAGEELTTSSASAETSKSTSASTTAATAKTTSQSTSKNAGLTDAAATVTKTSTSAGPASSAPATVSAAKTSRTAPSGGNVTTTTTTTVTESIPVVTMTPEEKLLSQSEGIWQTVLGYGAEIKYVIIDSEGRYVLKGGSYNLGSGKLRMDTSAMTVGFDYNGESFDYEIRFGGELANVSGEDEGYIKVSDDPTTNINLVRTEDPYRRGVWKNVSGEGEIEYVVMGDKFGCATYDKNGRFLSLYSLVRTELATSGFDTMNSYSGYTCDASKKWGFRFVSLDVINANGKLYERVGFDPAEFGLKPSGYAGEYFCNEKSGVSVIIEEGNGMFNAYLKLSEYYIKSVSDFTVSGDRLSLSDHPTVSLSMTKNGDTLTAEVVSCSSTSAFTKGEILTFTK